MADKNQVKAEILFDMAKFQGAFFRRGKSSDCRFPAKAISGGRTGRKGAVR